MLTVAVLQIKLHKEVLILLMMAISLQEVLIKINYFIDVLYWWNLYVLAQTSFWSLSFLRLYGKLNFLCGAFLF